jgi:hypothetical protein
MPSPILFALIVSDILLIPFSVKAEAFTRLRGVPSLLNRGVAIKVYFDKIPLSYTTLQKTYKKLTNNLDFYDTI